MIKDYFSSVLYIIFAAIIDSSYKIIIGVANITWLITSGGVSIAEAIKETKIAYRLFSASHLGVIKPDLTNNNKITGYMVWAIIVAQSKTSI